jgi:hypothetical protein
MRSSKSSDLLSCEENTLTTSNVDVRNEWISNPTPLGLQRAHRDNFTVHLASGLNYTTYVVVIAYSVFKQSVSKLFILAENKKLRF